MSDPRDIETLPGDDPSTARAQQFTLIASGALFAERYRIEARIGAGGTGEVYAALDTLSNTRVALKVLFPRGADDLAQLERLRRELRIVRSLTHPGIVRTHDVGRHGGLLYVVMDLLEGETLAVRLRRGTLEPGEAVAIVDGILDALAVAHEAGITHRDIKPANVFLRSGGAGVVLLDFGLARQSDDVTLTATGAFVGTPEYVAPEQARGERGVGPAADVYSAGIVLWEMLSGTPPFSGDSTPEVLLAHATRPLPSPRATLHVARPWLRDLAAWMLAKDAARRPTAAIALRTLRARRRAPLSQRLRTAGAARRRRLWIVAVAMLLIAAGVASRIPARVEVRDPDLIVCSVLGTTLHKRPITGGAMKALPLRGNGIVPREYLVLTHRAESNSEESPALPLSVIDAWTGAVRPFAIRPDREWSRIVDAAFPHFSREFDGKWMERVPWPLPDGRQPIFLAFNHDREYPHLVLSVDDDGNLLLIITHPGTVEAPVFVPAGGAVTRPLVVLPFENHDLGHQPGLLAVALTFLNVTNTGWVRVPPYPTTMVSSTIQGTEWITFLPEGRYVTATLERGVLATINDEGGRFKFDLARGTPLDGPEAVPGASRWIENGDALLKALETTPLERDPAHAANRFEGIAAAPGAASSQRGVALGQAAALWRRAGDLERALAASRAAMKAAPHILGHARTTLDLLARRGDWDGISEVFRQNPSRQGAYLEFRRDYVIAGIMLGKVDELKATIEPSGVADDLNATSLFVRAAGALERGFAGHDARAFDDAAAAAEELPIWADDPDLAITGAIAHALREPHQLDRAEQMLAAAERRRGAGRHQPTVALRALIAAKRGWTGPSPVDIEKALAAQREAGREDIVDWWYARWGERLVEASGALPR